jgi:hypothetical protein
MVAPQPAHRAADQATGSAPPPAALLAQRGVMDRDGEVQQLDHHRQVLCPARIGRTLALLTGSLSRQQQQQWANPRHARGKVSVRLKARRCIVTQNQIAKSRIDVRQPLKQLSDKLLELAGHAPAEQATMPES